MVKPRVDMARLSIPKAAVPFAGAPSPVPVLPGSGKSFTVKLEAADHWALRDYRTRQERATGQRVTHQKVMVTALRTLLGRRTAA
jgi:hypothetical protein